MKTLFKAIPKALYGIDVFFRRIDKDNYIVIDAYFGVDSTCVYYRERITLDELTATSLFIIKAKAVSKLVYHLLFKGLKNSIK